MKKLRMNFSLISFAALLVSVFACLGIFGLVNSGSRAVFADEPGNPLISVFLADNEIEGGEFKIGMRPITLNGTGTYTFSSAGETINLIVTVWPHYEFVGYTIYYYDALTEGFVLDENDTEERKQTTYPLLLQDVSEYEIYVEFKIKEYELIVLSQWFDNRSLDISNDISGDLGSGAFKRINFTSNLITLDEEAEFKNDIWNEDGLRFSHVEIFYFTGRGSNDLGIQPLYELTFNSANLGLYANEDAQIWVIGVYVETFDVNIGIPNFHSLYNGIEISIISPVFNKPETFESHARSFRGWVDKGSLIVINALHDDYYTFAGYTFLDGEAPGIFGNGGLQAMFKVFENYRIYANFEPVLLTLTLLARDSNGNLFDLSGHAYIKMTLFNTGLEPGKANINDVMEEVIFHTALQGFGVLGTYSVKRATSDVLDPLVFSTSTSRLTPAFLQKYLYNDGIILVVHVIRQYDVNFIVPQLSAGMGTYEVFVNGGSVGVQAASKMFRFNIGDNVEIKASEGTFRNFGGFSGVANDDIFYSKAEKRLIFVAGYDRTVNVNFSAVMFSVKDGAANSNVFMLPKTVSVGDVLTLSLSYNLAPNQTIKDWKIFGDSYTKWSSIAELEGSTLKITLNEAFIMAYSNWSAGGTDLVISSEAIPGMETGVLLMILIPSIAIPVLAAVLLLLWLQNMKRKRIVRTMVTEKMQSDMTRNTAGFISDLKAGNIASTDAQVKKGMKDKDWRK
ncbi:MAG: hypothetical protein FWE53_00395 [Firmicutes bacterium]|nr:hypothetical protein [Bacillota bacterium]